jgi:hypothetical protein
VKPVIDRFLSYINSPDGQAILKNFDPHSGKLAISFEIENKYKLVVYGYGLELFRDGISIHHSKTVLSGLSKMLRR